MHGLLFSVAATGRDAHGTVPVKVGLDLAELQRATGGQFTARGRLVALPACAATTPSGRPAGSAPRSSPTTTRPPAG
ncbi:hypothetical protein O1L60_40355 [Streptomyces diastatochromogenes]|nr:hypothetical protein [Streptomyces diastatochromogenes]